MREFVLFTDSSCDLPADLADQLGLAVVPLSVTVGEDTYKNYLDGREITAKAFYDAIRDGRMCIPRRSTRRPFWMRCALYWRKEKTSCTWAFPPG